MSDITKEQITELVVAGENDDPAKVIKVLKETTPDQWSVLTSKVLDMNVADIDSAMNQKSKLNENFQWTGASQIAVPPLLQVSGEATACSEKLSINQLVDGVKPILVASITVDTCNK